AIQTRPIYLHLTVNSGINGEVETQRLRIPFDEQGLYDHVTQIYFHAPRTGHYEATLTVGHGTRVPELVVDCVELRNPLGELTFVPIKTQRVRYRPEQVEALRKAAERAG